MASSEGYALKLRRMRSSLEADKKRLAELIRTRAKKDILGRDRATIEAEIRQQERAIEVAARY